MLIIVGLGPGSGDYLGAKAKRALETADKIFVRTSWHPVLEELDLDMESFDKLYEEAEDFESLYEGIAQRVIQESQHGRVVYAVPGSPWIAERSVEKILEKQQAEVIGGVSFLEPVLAALRIDPTVGLDIRDALSPWKSSGRRGLIILQCYSRQVASQLKLRLLEAYPDDHPVTVVRWAGIAGKEKLLRLELREMDHQEIFDHLTTIYLPAVEKVMDMETLLDVTHQLRMPGGCPWDREQDHASLRRYLLEECYEVLEAIESDDSLALEDELGDLLFQVVIHAQIAKEAGEFDFSDVVRQITDKIIRRHTHVFQKDRATDGKEVVEVWEANKAKEQSRQQRIARIPKGSPLHYAQKLTKLLGVKAGEMKHQDLAEALLEIVLEANAKDLSLDLLLREKIKKLLEIHQEG